VFTKPNAFAQESSTTAGAEKNQRDVAETWRMVGRMAWRLNLLLMPKYVPEQEHTGAYLKVGLFPENQSQMEHAGLLIIPGHLGKDIEISASFIVLCATLFY
jgi:hypothetical protein